MNRSLWVGAIWLYSGQRLRWLASAAQPGAGGLSTPTVFFPGKPIDLFEYGNSYTAFGFQSTSPVSTCVNGLSPMLEAMSLGQMRVKNPATYMVGTSGVTSTYLATNFASSVTPNFGNFDWLVMWGTCINDLLGGVSAATGLANIQAMYAACRAAGKTLLLGTPYATRTGTYAVTSTQGEQIATTCRTVAEWARDVPGVIYFDFWNDLVDPTQNLAAAYSNIQMADGLHLAVLGVLTVAKRCLATCQGFLTTPTITQGQLDVYDASNNPGGNIFSTVGTGAIALAGTSGTINTGCSGTLPTGWSVTRAAGSDTIVCSTVTGVGAYGSVGTNQFTVGVTSAASQDQVAVASFPSVPAGIVGLPCEVTMQVNVPSPTTGFSDVALQMLPNYAAGSQWGLRRDTLSSGYWRPGNYLMRTPPFVIPTGTTTMQLQIYIYFQPGASLALTFSKPEFRLVNQ